MSEALTPAPGGAEVLARIKQLMLDSVSTPLTRVMYARALDDFRLVAAQDPAGVHPRHRAILAGGARIQGGLRRPA